MRSSIYLTLRLLAMGVRAEELGLQEAVKLIDQNLQEERKTDALLTQFAEARINRKAA